MRAVSEMIADLDRIRPAESLLLDDVDDPLPRCQQKCCDGRWDVRGNLHDLFIADDARAARHV